MNLRIIPQSIGGRLLLCSVVILCFIQIISLATFYFDNQNTNKRFNERMATMRIAGVINTIDKISPDNYQNYLVSQHHPGLFFFTSSKAIFTADNIPQANNAEESVDTPNSSIIEIETAKQISAELATDGHNINISKTLTSTQKEAAISGCMKLKPLVNPERMPKRCHRLNEILKSNSNIVTFAGTVDTPNGEFLNFIGFSMQNSPFHLSSFCIFTILALTLIGSTALYGLIKFTVKPLNKLTEQTYKLSQNYKSEPLKEEGASEIQNLIRSFNRMQKKLSDFISDRTRILASISHDLKTPLTSMALRAEFLPDSEDKTKLIKNIDTMTAMVKATLQFARSDENSGTAVPLDLHSFLEGMCSEYHDNGADVSFITQGDMSLAHNFSCIEMEMRRIIQNLIDNALSYGSKAELVLCSTKEEITISVSDDGPGIPEDKLDEVFAPFMRMDKARDTTDGHAGLGLAIVRNSVLKQGGTIVLKNIEPHGLKAIISYKR